MSNSEVLVPVNTGILPLKYYLPETVSTNLSMAELAYKSGLLSPEIRSPQACLYIMQRGASLGLDPFFALENTFIVKGKLFLSIHAAQAILASNGLKWKILQNTNTKAEVTLMREGWDPVTVLFTHDDAVKAQLPAKDSYRNFPADVLYANAFRRAARRIAADLLMGVSIVDEIELRDGPAVVGFAPVAEEQPAQLPEAAPTRGWPKGKPRGSKKEQSQHSDASSGKSEVIEAAVEQQNVVGANSDQLTAEVPPDLTHDNVGYHECDTPPVDLAPAAGTVEVFDPTNGNHRDLLTQACNQLGFDAKWRNENRSKIFFVLHGCPATYPEIHAKLFAQQDWSKVGAV